MRKKWLVYDLQFFADGGEGESDNADQTETNEGEDFTEDDLEDDPEDNPEDEGDEPEEEEEDRDSIYAAARRRAEAEIRSKYEKEQSERDAWFAELCKGRVNPETNEPITNEAEYIEALQAQQRVNINAELTEKGIDPSVIEQMLANNPTLKQAQRVIAESQEREAQTQIEQDIKSILALDKTYTSEDDLVNSEEFKKAVQYCNNVPGTRLTDAYKIVNFDALRSAGVKAAKQAAINEAKGKGHLTSPNSPTGKGNVEIPEGELPKWKRMFPNRSHKELTSIYAKVAESKR